MEIIDFLIKHGSDVNTADRDGDTPLHTSVLNFLREEIVDLLIKSGANINATNGNQETPLHYASKQGTN